MFNFLGSVGNFVTSAVSNTFSFAGSAVRNTLTFASNVLPDAGVLGNVGDWAGNALTFGSDTVYSGGGSGGSFLTPLGIGPQVEAAPYSFPSLSSQGAAEVSAAASPSLAPAAAPATATATEDTSSTGLGAQTGADANTAPQYLALHEATMAPRWDALDTRAENVGHVDRARDVVGHIRAAYIEGNKRRGGVSGEVTRILGTSFSEDLAALDEQIKTGGIDTSLLGQYEMKAAALDSLLSNPSENVILAGIQKDVVLQTAAALKPIDVSVGDAVANDPLVQQFNADVDSYNQRLTAVNAMLEANGGEYTPEVLANLSALYTASGPLASQQLTLRAKTYRDGWSRYGYDGSVLGVDLEYVGQWVQWLTPFALAGIQYAWQSSVDDKNRKWQEKVRAEDREFEERMLSMRLSAQERIAGISAEGSAPAAVGASSGISINAGTASA